ncbi:UDP-glucuronosyltransferase 1-2-like [Saccoglossus kowalevskii]|uniref:UDP-glucuronosyltransferase 1-2-like n=1 Tax=Saccoglossus kowalevskii TaxID=10224 RepID=A0ABM0MA46_SACKO|nr:PREDICTED: UDP-glucuronosyltransferase 1-2-like [Saccoglossus kowalevskii]
MAACVNSRWIGAIVIACVICPVLCSNILILPGSPLGNLYITVSRFGELLATRGHNVTVLINDLYYQRFAGLIKQQRTFMNFEEYKSGFNEFPDAYNLVTKSAHTAPSIFETLRVFDALADETEAFIQDSNTIERLNASNFDLILANVFNPGYALIVGTLRVPFVVISTTRALPVVDDLLHGLTSNPAYVPAVLTGYSDVMTFPQRLSNTFVYLVSAAMFEFVVLKPFKSIQQRYNIRPEISYRSLGGNSELVLFCSDFAFDYPRPMMPHAIYIGSLTARTPYPLSQVSYVKM